MPETVKLQNPRKLVDVWGSLDACVRLHEALQRFLQAHAIAYTLASREDPYGRPFWRYSVQACHLSSAQTVLPALREIQAWAIRGGAA